MQIHAHTMQNAPMQITIDSNCINTRGKLDGMNQLESWSYQNKIVLVGSERLLVEMGDWKNNPSALNKAKQMQNISEPFTVGFSRIGHAYVTVENTPTFRNVAEIMFPEEEINGLSKNESNDIMHMLSHLHSQSQIFVTLNTKDFIDDGRNEKFMLKFKAIVLTDKECVEYLTKQYGF